MIETTDTTVRTRRACGGTIAASVLLSALVAAGVSYAMMTMFDPDGGVPAVSGTGAADQQLVLNTIRDNPEVIIESLENMRAKQIAEQQDKARSQLSESREQLTQDEDSPVIGNPSGDVTVVEFFDYHCGYCKRMMPTVKQLIADDANVRVVLKEFPILSPDSEAASRASLAVYTTKPEAYWAFHQALMEHNGAFDEAFLLQAAETAGADRAAVQEAMKSEEVAKEIADNHALASQLGIQGTPALVIGDTLIPGAVDLEQVKAAVAQARNGGEPQPLAEQDATGDAPVAPEPLTEGEAAPATEAAPEAPATAE